MPPKNTSSKTMLIIDDETDAVNTLKFVLESEDYEVLTAADGESGLDIFIKRYKDIDLVLLDLTLPGISGRDVFKKLKSKGSTVPVIIHSGADSIDLDADALIEKPASLDTVMEVIRSICP